VIEIKPIEPHQIGEAKRVILTVVKQVFNNAETVDELLIIHADWLADVDDLQAHYFARRGIFLVALDDGRVIGTGAIRPMNEKTCELKRMWLLEAYHGKGIGYRVMQELLAFARPMGYEKMELLTEPKQARAVRFYQRVGFQIIRTAQNLDDDLGMEMAL
jgi:putative acetyltransferase